MYYLHFTNEFKLFSFVLLNIVESLDVRVVLKIRRNPDKGWPKYIIYGLLGL